MNKKAVFLLCALLFFCITLSVEILYIKSKYSITNLSILHKNIFTAKIGLGDLAISTEATYIRHRTLGNIFDIYKDSPSLREYFVSTYAISDSKIINKRNNEK